MELFGSRKKFFVRYANILSCFNLIGAVQLCLDIIVPES